MKKLNFIFKNDNIEIMNMMCDYEFMDNTISFHYDDFHLRFTKGENFISFVRESEDDSLEIINEMGNLKGIIKLDEPALEVPIKVFKFECNWSDDKVIINYIIESDEQSEKTIILSLVN